MMNGVKAVAKKYNEVSLILRIVAGLVIGAVLALAVPGAGWVGAGLLQAGPPLWHGHLAVYADNLPCGGHRFRYELCVPRVGRSG